MLLLEDVLVLLRRRHDVGHVHLVEGGQHGRRVLRLLEAGRDGLAEPRHLHAFLARAVVAGGARLNRRGGRLRLRGRFGIFLGDAAAAAGAFDLRDIEIVFGGDAAHGRRRLGIGGLRRRFRFGFRGFGFRFRLGLGFFWLFLPGGRSGCLALAFADLAQERADLDRLAVLDHDFAEHAGSGRRHFDRHLVGLELDQRLIRRHLIARLLEPLRDGRLRHRFAQRGHANFRRHSSLAFPKPEPARSLNRSSARPKETGSNS